MNQDDVDGEFKALAFRTMAEDLEQIMNEVIRLEGQARHEIGCNDDHIAANKAASDAASLFMTVQLNLVPTLIMAMADKFNREKESLLALLEVIHHGAAEIGIAVNYLEAGNQRMALAHLHNLADKYAEALEEAPYERAEDADE